MHPPDERIPWNQITEAVLVTLTTAIALRRRMQSGRTSFLGSEAFLSACTNLIEENGLLWKHATDMMGRKEEEVVRWLLPFSTGPLELGIALPHI